MFALEELREEMPGNLWWCTSCPLSLSLSLSLSLTHSHSLSLTLSFLSTDTVSSYSLFGPPADGRPRPRCDDDDDDALLACFALITTPCRVSEIRSASALVSRVYCSPIARTFSKVCARTSTRRFVTIPLHVSIRAASRPSVMSVATSSSISATLRLNFGATMSSFTVEYLERRRREGEGG